MPGDLPPGIHDISWDETEREYATNAVRMGQFEGAREAAECLYAAGIETVILGGEFVSSIDSPERFVMLLDASGIDWDTVDECGPEIGSIGPRPFDSQELRFGGRFRVHVGPDDEFGDLLDLELRDAYGTRVGALRLASPYK